VNPIFALLPGVLAAEPPSTSMASPVGVAVGASLVGEAIHDSAISLVYGDTSLSGEGSATATFVHGIEATLSVGYRRMSGLQVDARGTPTEASSWLWYAPIALTAGASWKVGDVSVFGGIGPSIVVWAEQAKLGDAAGFNGGKYGLLIDAGVRVPVPGVGPSLFAPDRGLRGVDIVADIGYRATFRTVAGCAEAPCGLDFSALRLGVGARARF
jgi:hypothetical protein